MTKNDLIFWLCFVLISIMLVAVMNTILILIFSALCTLIRRENGQYYFTIKESNWRAATRDEAPKVYYHERCTGFAQAYLKYVTYFFKHWWKWWLEDGWIIFF